MLEKTNNLHIQQYIPVTIYITLKQSRQAAKTLRKEQQLMRPGTTREMHSSKEHKRKRTQVPYEEKGNGREGKAGTPSNGRT